MSSPSRRIGSGAGLAVRPAFGITGEGLIGNTRGHFNPHGFPHPPPLWGDRSVEPDVDFVSLSKIEDSMASMQRLVFERIKPLEAQPGSKSNASASGCRSPGLADEMQELSFSSKMPAEGKADETKPSMSFACLIAMAILDSDAKRLTVSEVYEWMKRAYPYFSSPAAGTGWKNSVRHNLSLNKHFVKQNRDDDQPGGKGSFWRIRPESMVAMEAAIRKQGSGQLSRRLEGVLNNMTREHGDKPKSFTPKVSLSRRGQISRPKPQSTRRLQKVDRPQTTSPMNDQEAAAMLCSFAAVPTSGESTAGTSEMVSPGSASGSPKLASPRGAGIATSWLPGLSTGLLSARHRSAGGRDNFVSPNPPKQRAQYKASYNPNASKGDAPTTRTFTYVPSNKQRPRRGLSATANSGTNGQERLFTPKAMPPVGDAKMSPPESPITAADVTLEDVPRSRTSSSSAEQSMPLFTFSAPLSTAESRYTPEGPNSSRTRVRSDSTGSQTDEGKASQTGIAPRKTRRKLGIVDMEASATASMDAVAALLDLAC